MPTLTIEVDSKVMTALGSEPSEVAAEYLSKLMTRVPKDLKGLQPMFVPEWCLLLGLKPDRAIAARVFNETIPAPHQITDVSTTRTMLGRSAWRKQSKKRALNDGERKRIWRSMRGLGFTRTHVVKGLGLNNIENARNWAEGQGLLDLVEHLKGQT